MSVGNGRVIKFWVDVWVEEVPLKSLTRAKSLEDQVGKMAAEFWLSYYGWKWHLFEGCLPMNTLLKLTATVLSVDEEKRDRLIWALIQGGLHC